jgi:hypothetical protein
MERSSPPVVSAASLTTLHQVLSCFLEPCSQGTSPVGAAKVYWHQLIDTLAFIMGAPALDYLKPYRGTKDGRAGDRYMRDAMLADTRIQSLLESHGTGGFWLNEGRTLRADDGNGKVTPSHRFLQWRLATDTGEVVAGDASDVTGARISWRAADAGSSRETVRLYLASFAAEQGHRDVIAAAGGRLQRASEWDGSVVAFFYVLDQLLSDPGACVRRRH